MTKKMLVPSDSQGIEIGTGFAIPVIGAGLLIVPGGVRTERGAVVYTGKNLEPSDLMNRLAEIHVEQSAEQLALLARFLGGVAQAKIGDIVTVSSSGEIEVAGRIVSANTRPKLP